MLQLGWALTVVTSSLPITPALPARPGLQVLVTGGRAVAAGHGRPGAGYFARFGERDEPGTLRADADAGDGLVPELGSGGLRVAQA